MKKINESAQGSLKSYTIGFILCVFLTVVPFALVMTGAAPILVTLIIIALFAVIQILVQLIYFLHMNRDSDGGWNFIALVFSGVIIGIVVVGSLWIMYNLNINMMPS